MNLSFSSELLESSIDCLLHDMDFNGDAIVMTREVAEWLRNHRELVIDLGLPINNKVMVTILLLLFPHQ